MSDGMMEAYRSGCRDRALGTYMAALHASLVQRDEALVEPGRKALINERMTDTLAMVDGRASKMKEGCPIAWARMIHAAGGHFVTINGNEHCAAKALQHLSPFHGKTMATFSQGYGFTTISASILKIFEKAIERGVIAGRGPDDQIRVGDYTLVIDEDAIETLASTMVIRRSRDERPAAKETSGTVKAA
jgi:hypothetical protein